MSITFRCPSCDVRWKILDSPDERTDYVNCPNCPPPGQLIAQTFEDCCRPDKDAT